MADQKRTIISEYYDLAMKYKELAVASLEELNECKKEMMQMKAEIMNRSQVGQYLWDSKRIIISAPEIIIGNVNMNGELMEGGSVIIKGSGVGIDGVGDSGSITMRAPAIKQRAVNPGIDGNGEVVGAISSITSVARDVHLVSEDPQTVEGGVFLPPMASQGITLKSDTTISLNGTKDKKYKKKRIDDIKTQLKRQKDALESAVDQSSTFLYLVKENVERIVAKDSDLSKENDLTKTNILILDELQSKMKVTVDGFLGDMREMVNDISVLAEVNRQIACLDKELEELDKVDDDKFKKESTKTSVNINSENIRLISADAEGNVRTNPGAGILLRGNNISLQSMDEKGTMTPEESKGRVSVISRNIELSTSDITDVTKDDKGKRTKAKFPAVGNVTIRSKTVDIESVDYEQTDENKFKETKLTEDSSINIRSQKVKVKTIDEKGKSVGKFSVNSQKISMKATDIKGYKVDKELDDQGNFKHPEKMESEKVAADSAMLLLAETMNVGYKKKDQLASKIYIVGDEQVLLKGTKKVDVTQNGKNIVHFEDGTAEVSSSDKLTLAGKDTVIHGNIALKGAVKAGDIEVENLKASKSVTAPNISDGMAVPGAPATFSQKKGPDAENSNL